MTGGEPLAQPVFTAALLAAARAEGYHTVLDTSGAGGGEAVRQVLRHTSLVLADLKFTTEEGYARYTGGSLAVTLQFLQTVARLRIPLWVRHVVVPGLTDGAEHLERLAALLQDCPTLQKVELLPFRKLCTEKYASMGVKFPLEEIPEATEGDIDRARCVLAGFLGRGVAL